MDDLYFALWLSMIVAAWFAGRRIAAWDISRMERAHRDGSQ